MRRDCSTVAVFDHSGGIEPLGKTQLATRTDFIAAVTGFEVASVPSILLPTTMNSLRGCLKSGNLGQPP